MRSWGLALLSWACACGAQTVRDDFFAYPADSDGAPRWTAESLGARFGDGALRVDGGAVIWSAVPYASQLTFAADLTIEAVTGRPADWQTAGIAIHADAGNAWVLNLVVAPEQVPVRRYLELHERLDGVWLAESEPASRLPALEIVGGEHAWRDGVTYRLEITLAADRITGTVSEAGREVGRFTWQLTGTVPMVRAGRPALQASGLLARFDNVAATVRQTAPEPAPRRDFPAWAPTDAPRLTEPTGFFATAQRDGRWWLVDPDGRAFFAVGTDHCRMSGHWCEKLGYAPYGRNMQEKYGTPGAWADSAAERLRQWRFNSVAAGHGPEIRYHGLPHILFASFGSRFARREWIAAPTTWTGFPNVFSPDWPRHCRLVAREIARESRSDPWCLGIFLDNELEWYGKDGQLVHEVFRRGPEHTAKQALLAFLIERYGSLAEANRRLDTSYADEAAFLASTALPPAGDELAALRDAFLGVIAERYFSIACAAMREADPDHLILGCRFAGQTPEPCLAPAGRYNDVFSINTYPRIDLATGRLQGVQRQFSEYFERVGKPFMITEWSFPALDSGLPCRYGAGMRVDTQAQKAQCYEIFANAMADLPFLVGYNYFMWVDEPALGISSTFPEDSNYGLVNEQDVPYRELVETATRVNAGAAARHGRSVPFSEPPELAGWRRTLLEGAPRAVEAITIETAGTLWRAAVGPGPLFPDVSAGDLLLGELTVALHQVLGDENLWVSADRVVSIARYGELPAWDVLVELAGAGDVVTPVDAAGRQAPARTGPARYRAAVRVSAVPEQPAIAVQPLWVESLDPREWLLEEIFLFARPRIGGEAADDELGGPAVPNYYLPSAFWTDPARGGAFGSATGGGSPWQITWWKDEGGNFHPDTRLPLRETMHAGRRLTVPEVPGAWVYALRDGGRWREVTAAAQAGAQALLTP